MQNDKLSLSGLNYVHSREFVFTATKKIPTVILDVKVKSIISLLWDSI